MLLTILSYLMIIIFMFVIMKKKLSPLTALILVPLVFVIIVLIINGTPLVNIGEYIMEGVVGKKGTAKIGIMLLFAILYFSIMLDAGLFDPVTNKMIRYAKGDPMKVLIATAVVSAVKLGAGAHGRNRTGWGSTGWAFSLRADSGTDGRGAERWFQCSSTFH